MNIHKQDSTSKITATITLPMDSGNKNDDFSIASSTVTQGNIDSYVQPSPKLCPTAPKNIATPLFTGLSSFL